MWFTGRPMYSLQKESESIALRFAKIYQGDRHRRHRRHHVQ